ncbi:NAD(P)-dependent oxidoreductase [Granulicella sibirica]|uniref:2-hydroxy-3-oxopropionate reductase n=1 Tax=Granulicella sibirica TaxID=2479048 RepID=A0A4Q0SXQ5_9BACT|nr:NAD(P)-dependent oxidoreductase [Granulicella sibirica]RXH54780.1 2-hydroxy-3-oxopropionate reductase [Granulicella sibirica]
MAQTVAILGLGTMGLGMADNLLKAGFSLSVYNRTAAKADGLRERGAKVGATPEEAVKGASVIVSMLSDDAASRQAWVGGDGALAGAEDGAVLVEASTVSPAWIAELGGLAHARGLELLDAPVTGSRVAAATGQLAFLVGGSAGALAKVDPVLKAMSKEIVYLGPAGSGAKLKLVNNFLCGVQIASLAEGLAWLERSGLDVEKALGVLKSGAPGSPLLAGISARMLGRDYTVNFLLSLMSKDLLYAHEAAAEAGVELTTATNARALFESAATKGFADQDMASVIEPIRNA